ncbi:MAG TPA: hypothetical protein PKD51_11525 [Saprospiraceae bacterium]|nr:hypothetical protein [Saprospiraceae bacterium]HMU05628.1 hypothetical protein [Saprospiraceae bacterium]
MTRNPEYYEWFMTTIATIKENNQISIHIDVLRAKLDYNRTDFFVMLKEWGEGYNINRPKTFEEAVELFIKETNEKYDLEHVQDAFNKVITFRKKKPISSECPFDKGSSFEAAWKDLIFF